MEKMMIALHFHDGVSEIKGGNPYLSKFIKLNMNDKINPFKIH